MLWGREEHLREIFGEAITDVQSHERVCTFRYETPEAFVTFFRRYYGPTLRAFGSLDRSTQTTLFAELAQLAEAADVHRDGTSIAIPAVYLETIARRTG